MQWGLDGQPAPGDNDGKKGDHGSDGMVTAEPSISEREIGKLHARIGQRVVERDVLAASHSF